MTGLCPECAEPVASSLRGNLLQFSSPDYVRTLYRGVSLVLWSILLDIVAFVGSTLAGFVLSSIGSGTLRASVAFLMQLTMLSTAIMAAYGWFLLSEADPAFQGNDPGTRPRKVVRASTIAYAAGSLLSFVLESTNIVPPTLAGTLGILTMIVFIVRYFSSMLYIQWLAPRLPNERVLLRARRMMWLGPMLMTLGLLLIGLGPIIALVLYWNMLDWVRQDIRRILLEQHYERTA